MKDLYHDRCLSEGYPGLEAHGVERYRETQDLQSRVSMTIECIGKLIDLTSGLRTVTVVGCGPQPVSLRRLVELGYDAVGVEPVAGFAAAAQAFVGEATRILTASAEALPLPACSQRVVLLENVLEHVDSPRLSLEEAFRVLVPGGVAHVYTSNRIRVSPRGYNGEYNIPFFNWLPELVKECYVHHHLHFAPSLANWTARPAVHWFTFAELCKLGRDAGFARFYSPIDLLDPRFPSNARSRLEGWLLSRARTTPLLRALALVQFGNAIFLWKRPVG